MAIPAFSATGILSFYLTADPDTEQEWARLGGMVGLQVEDADLDVPIKYVILPNDLDQVGTTTIVTVADSDTITVADALVVHPVTTNNPDSAGILAVGNTLLVEGNTVRVVEQIDLDADGDGDNANDDATVTLNRSLSVGGMTVVSEVNNNFANGEDCPTCAEAPKVTLTTGQQILNLKNTPIIDSGAGSSTNKFDDTGNDKTVDGDDVALVSIGSTDATVGNAVSSGTVFITVATQGDVHAVYWGSSENDTDDTITVRSSGDSDGIEVVLDETGASTGVFRQSIELIDEYPTPKVPNQIRVEPNGTVTLPVLGWKTRLGPRPSGLRPPSPSFRISAPRMTATER